MVDPQFALLYITALKWVLLDYKDSHEQTGKEPIQVLCSNKP